VGQLNCPSGSCFELVWERTEGWEKHAMPLTSGTGRPRREKCILITTSVAVVQVFTWPANAAAVAQVVGLIIEIECSATHLSQPPRILAIGGFSGKRTSAGGGTRAGPMRLPHDMSALLDAWEHGPSGPKTKQNSRPPGGLRQSAPEPPRSTRGRDRREDCSARAARVVLF
jgi:hypothetical protein